MVVLRCVLTLLYKRIGTVGRDRSFRFRCFGEAGFVRFVSTGGFVLDEGGMVVEGRVGGDDTLTVPLLSHSFVALSEILLTRVYPVLVLVVLC